MVRLVFGCVYSCRTCSARNCEAKARLPFGEKELLFVTGAAQNRAASVCAGVRTALVADPIRCVSR